jgi:peptidoglycan/LPS O-acetylase OafA/YrhL
MYKRQITSRIAPISSIRFVLAMWVALGHFGIPFLRDQQHDRILWAVRAFLNNAFNGPAAVIAFFVISGFCIHFPNRKGLFVRSWKAYYARRYVRILIPMAVAIALSLPLGMQFGLFTDSILWSLLCEEIYYFLYPALLALRDRIGWRGLMTVAGVLALLTVLTNPHAGDYPSYGPGLNWALGLPCWLLGCIMAERLEIFSSIPISSARVWIWRIGVWALSVILSILRFHTPIGYPWTFDFFAVVAVLWLEREIRYYQAGRKPLFENLGEASYSIYLTHTHAPAILSMLAISRAMSPAGTWLWSIILCGIFATTFYWTVERPSHRLARRVSRPKAAVEVVSAVAAQ